MAVLEEWLSSTEPGLQIDSPIFYATKPLKLTADLNQGMAEFSLRSIVIILTVGGLGFYSSQLWCAVENFIIQCRSLPLQTEDVGCTPHAFSIVFILAPLKAVARVWIRPSSDFNGDSVQP